MSSPIAYGINVLQVGAMRMPMLFASINGTLIIGELVLRTTQAALQWIGFSGDSDLARWFSKNTPDIVVAAMRPYRNHQNEQLITTAIACCVIGIVGNELVSVLFGKPPAIYNQILTYLGPIRVSGDRHPAIAALIRYNR